MKRYEGLFILNTAGKEEGIKEAIDKISAEMQKVIKENHKFERVEVSGDEARRMLAHPTNTVTKAIWESRFRGGNWPNHYVGGQIHEEDSPGNFVLREKNGYVEYVIYDAQGAEQVLQTWLPAQPK